MPEIANALKVAAARPQRNVESHSNREQSNQHRVGQIEIFCERLPKQQQDHPYHNAGHPSSGMKALVGHGLRSSGLLLSDDFGGQELERNSYRRNNYHQS